MPTLVTRNAIGALIMTIWCFAPAQLSGQISTRPSSIRSADDWVTTQIQARYFTEPEIKARQIVVFTVNGIVTLQGEVEDQEERRRAVDIAARVNGVKDVVDSLRVRTESGVIGTAGTVPPSAADRQATQGEGMAVGGLRDSDRVILAETSNRLAADPQVNAFDVRVSVEHGIVTLSGDVNDHEVRARAEQLARDVAGVRGVRNELRLRR